MQTDRKIWSLRNSQSETWIHESGKKLAQAYLLPLSRTTLWHMGQSLSVLFSALWHCDSNPKSSSSNFQCLLNLLILKAMSLYLRLLGGHVSLFATVAISEPPLEPRKLQVAEAATATPWFKSFQIYIYIYSYIVSRCCHLYSNRCCESHCWLSIGLCRFCDILQVRSRC